MGDHDIIMKKETHDLIQAIYSDDTVVPKEFGGLAAAFPELADEMGLILTDEDQDFMQNIARIADRLAAADALAALLRKKLNQSSGLPSDIYEALKSYEAMK